MWWENIWGKVTEIICDCVWKREERVRRMKRWRKVEARVYSFLQSAAIWAPDIITSLQSVSVLQLYIRPWWEFQHSQIAMARKIFAKIMSEWCWCKFADEVGALAKHWIPFSINSGSSSHCEDVNTCKLFLPYLSWSPSSCCMYVGVRNCLLTAVDSYRI